MSLVAPSSQIFFALTFSIKKKPVKRAAAFDVVSTLEKSVLKFKHSTISNNLIIYFSQVL